MGEVNYAVLVKNARISYRSSLNNQQLVFRNVNLSVPVGTVYGLLGPSGCGKTTLLRCILGRLDLDQGSVFVFGHRPGTTASGVPGPSVGYMPQDTCMHATFTIGECWTYYGTILGLSKKQINDAIGYFINLLNLPPSGRVIGQLSGGEVRRVAFATALIHEPKLLILDEPTVGIDCITKKNIWEHLLKLANEKQTSVILTTHYIEEAKAAHKVGLMHGDTLAVEDYTVNLLQRFRCDSLENIFLKICFEFPTLSCVDIEEENHTNERSMHVGGQNVVQDVPFEECHRSSTCRLISPKDLRVRSYVLKALVLKHLIHLYRYPGVLIFVTLLPCIQFSMTVYSTTEDFDHVQLALVNEDLGPLGNQFSEILAEDVVHLKSFNGSRSSFDALHDGRLRGLVVIRQNFSEAHLERIFHFPLLKNSILNESLISVMLDNIEPHSSFVRFHLLDSYQRFLQSTYKDSGLNPLSAETVFQFGSKDVESLSRPRVLQLDLMAMVVVAYFAPAAVAVFTFFVEINCGYLERSIVAGVTSAEIVLGLLVVLLAVASIQVVSTLAIAYLLVFSKLSLGTAGLLFLVLYFTAITGMSSGIFLSLLCKQVQLLLIIAGNVMLLTVAVAGGFWPLAAAPNFARYVFLALPLAYPLKAICAIYLGAIYYPMVLASSLAVSLTHSIVFLAISMVLLRMKT